jgi:hypothetical protein
MTRGDLLRYQIAFALRRAAKIVRGLKQALTEDDRFAVADDVLCWIFNALQFAYLTCEMQAEKCLSSATQGSRPATKT